MTLIKQVFYINALAFLFSILTYAFHPSAPSWEKSTQWEMTIDEVKLYQNNILWVDARDKNAYEAGHIPEAINLNEHDLEGDIEAFMNAWDGVSRVIVYCDSLECGKSEHVANVLRNEYRVKEAYALKGGWELWIKNH
jgi:rhodanese-related sulfurtransferase